MRLYNIFCCGAFLFFGGILTLAQSDDGAYSDTPLVCPRIEVIESLNDLSCASLRDGEIAIPQIMQDEIKYFQTNIIIPLLADNTYDMDFATRKSTWQLRQHKECLIDFCKAYQEICPNTTKGLSNFVDQRAWCDDRVQETLILQQQNMAVHLQLNQSRKWLDTEEQKQIGFFVRLRKFVQEPLIRTIQGYEHIKTSITGLVRNPPTP